MSRITDFRVVRDYAAAAQATGRPYQVWATDRETGESRRGSRRYSSTIAADAVMELLVFNDGIAALWWANNTVPIIGYVNEHGQRVVG